MIELADRWQAAARPGRRVGAALEVHAAIGSTNDRARELLEGEGADGVVVVAEQQTAGRGRRGRSWFSPPGASLAMSAALRTRLPASDAWQLALGAGLAACTACEAVALVGLKWPNDVVAAVDRRKLGGTLIESVVEGDRLTGAVVGIGLNVAWPRAEMPPEIRDRATSLGELTGTAVDGPGLLGRLLDALSDEVEAIELGISPLGRYRARCVTIGRDVRVATADGQLVGRAVGLDERGGLIVESGGVTRVLATADVAELREAGS